jgi:dTDP-4-amino-4,6-dideoxygalactose transaminase
MQIIHAPRASAILYSLLTSQTHSLPWILPANICPIVPITFFKARIPFELVDISASTLHMDLEQVEALIQSRKYGGLLYAHTYGEPSTPNEFFANIKSIDSGLLILDDRCLCIPDLGPASNSTADITLYSTGYAKIVELNFGGYAFLNESIAYQPVHLSFNSKDHDELEKFYKESISARTPFNYHDTNWLDTNSEVPAWYDYCQQIKSHMNDSLAHRRTLNEIYSNQLPAAIQLPEAYQTWRFNLRVEGKKRIMDAIFDKGLFASSHYASLAGIMADGQAQQAEKLADEVINLFNDRHFTVEQAEQVSEIIRENLSWN